MTDNSAVQKILATIGTTPRKPIGFQDKFTMPVMSMSDDKSSSEIKLCTGKTIHIPTRIVKNIIPMGHLTTATEHFDLLYGELDVNTDAGKLMLQTAHEIDRLSRSIRRAAAPDAQSRLRTDIITRPSGAIVPNDYLLPAASTKWTFSGIAGTPQQLVYSAPPYQYLVSFSIACNGCFVEPYEINTGYLNNNYKEPTGLEFSVDAAHGTPLGNAYNATVTLNFQLAQATT